MRGKQPEYEAAANKQRIIPAHAGQTRVVYIAVIVTADHPRACGANWSSWYARCSMSGSSPRMRGKQPEYEAAANKQRIIPAHAGQTRVVYIAVIVTADHPRACGANLWCWWLFCCFFGSSPRMRGKQGRFHRRVSNRRIIPAHAGQTRRLSLTK